MKNMRKEGFIVLLLCLAMTLCACGSQSQIAKKEEIGQNNAENNSDIIYGDMTWEQAYELTYATGFSVKACEGYKLISIKESEKTFLIVPEGKGIPRETPGDIVILQRPIDNVYLAASAVFDFVVVLDALDRITLSGAKEDNLYIDGAREYMEQGKIKYAGKYNMPDYELIVSQGSKLAIENTMIYHSPETIEKLEAVGITVFVECSSREAHPLGRMEWIKLYGTLFDKEEEAISFFNEQTQNVENMIQMEKTDVTIAFFYVNSNGIINVRRPGDYISKMIELCGGVYVIGSEYEEEESSMSTMNMQIEDFYLAARDADIIIYNGIMDGGLESIDDLTRMNPLFKEFKAVKNARVYSTSRDFYQETSSLGRFMEDLSHVIHGQDEGLYFLKKVK